MIKQNQQKMVEMQRQELLGPQMVDITNKTNRKTEATILDVEDRLGNAEHSIDEYLKIGRNALSDLYDQRSMLKVTIN